MVSLRRRAKAAPNPDAQMSLTEHLAELRMRIIRAGLAVLIGVVVVVLFYDPILHFLVEPYRKLCERSPDGYCGESYDRTTDSVSLVYLDPIEGLAVRFRVAFYGGIILALPVLLWQLWKFIVPALHKHERRYALGFVTSSVVLFLLGGVIAFTTLERALEFLISWAGEGTAPVFQVDKYIRLVTLMFAAFGVGFTIPVLLVFLQMIGVIGWRTLLRAWRYAVVGTFIIAAAITPSGDPISLLALSVPMVVLFFLAVFVGRIFQRRRERDE